MLTKRRLKRSDCLLSENLEKSDFNLKQKKFIYKKNNSSKDIKNYTARCTYKRNEEDTIQQNLIPIEFYKTHFKANSKIEDEGKISSSQFINCNPKIITNRKKSAVISNKIDHIFKYNKELNQEMESRNSKSISNENSFSIENSNSNEKVLNNFKLKTENINDKISIFINLIKKYSDKLTTLSKLISSSTNNTDSINELIKTIEQLNEMINNPKLNSDFFNVNNCSQNNKINEKEYEMILLKNSELKKENSFLKNELSKEKKNCEKIINKFSVSSKITNELANEISKLKLENCSLINNCNHLNQVLSEVNKNKDFIKYENELIYKDNVIKYLENLLQNSDISQKMFLNNDYKEKIRKFTLMKQKEKLNNDLNNKKFIINENYFNKNMRENINKNSSKNKKKIIKKEIDHLDDEIFKLQNKIKKMMMK